MLIAKGQEREQDLSSTCSCVAPHQTVRGNCVYRHPRSPLRHVIPDRRWQEQTLKLQQEGETGRLDQQLHFGSTASRSTRSRSGEACSRFRSPLPRYTKLLGTGQPTKSHVSASDCEPLDQYAWRSALRVRRYQLHRYRGGNFPLRNDRLRYRDD